MKDQLKRLSPEALATNKEEEQEWSTELKRLQSLSPLDASLKRIKSLELPSLEQKIAAQEASIPAITEEAEEVIYRRPFRLRI
jgi:DNA repair protein RAD50